MSAQSDLYAIAVLEWSPFMFAFALQGKREKERKKERKKEQTKSTDYQALLMKLQQVFSPN